jgi:hypothetical protein
MVVINGKADGGREDGGARHASGHASSASSPRQQVTAELVSDKPTDLETMLALTDSIDDKATLAVSAYQTLARSAETQVQSLRKVAFGAWAVVGVMAAAIIVAVGWATHRLTSAEVTASHLQEKVSKQDEDLRKLSNDHEMARKRIEAMGSEAATLQEKNKNLASQAADAIKAAAEERAAVARLAASVISASATRPTTAPSASATNAQASPAVPAPQPAEATLASHGGAVVPGPNTRPTTLPAKPGTPQNPRPTYFTNSNEAFDPK